MKIRKGDTVYIRAGKHRGQTGTVLAALPKEQKVLVAGVNVMKRHTKPRGMARSGGIIDKQLGIHVSNVSLVDPASSAPTAIGYKFLEDGSKVRINKRTGNDI